LEVNSPHSTHFYHFPHHALLIKKRKKRNVNFFDRHAIYDPFQLTSASKTNQIFNLERQQIQSQYEETSFHLI